MLTQEEQVLLSRIDENDLIEFLRRLIRIHSENPSGSEKEIGMVIAEELLAAGCQVELQQIEGDRFNVIAVLEGENPDKLLYNGHMDTVQAGNVKLWTDDPWSAEIRDGMLFGLGSSDMKAGLAAMIFAVKTLANSGVVFRRGLMFTAVIDEEVAFKGTKALLAEKKLDDCKLAYVSEPTQLQIANSLKGALEFSARTYGKSAHTGIAFDGDNAIYKMGRFIEGLYRYNESLKSRMDLPILRYPTVNLGRIQGGIGVTFVPDFCEVEFDRQVLPSERMEIAEQEIRDLTETVNDTDRIGIELTLKQSFSNWSVSQNEDVVRNLSRTLQDLTGKAPSLTGFNGYAEVELLSAAGIPSVMFGPGSLHVAHAPNEFVLVSEVIEAAKAYTLLAHRFVTHLS